MSLSGAIGSAVRVPAWFVLCLVLAGVLVYPAVWRLVLQVEITAPQRGYAVAMRAGCFDCHGPDGTGGVANPGSKDGEVPGFTAGTLMMVVKNDAELRAWIPDGTIARLRDHPLAHYFIECNRLAV